MNNREIIARRVAQEFHNGDTVNLGIGIPTLAANYVPKKINILLQSENGMLGTGPKPEDGDDDCIDAGGNHVSILPGGAYFDSAVSFGLIRGKHVDETVLGALEVDQEGNLANWMVPGKRVMGMGGAMDLACGAKRVIIAMEHVNKDGSPKIVKKCQLPLTAKNSVSLIITNMAVIKVDREKGLILEEIGPGCTVEDVLNATDATLTVSRDLKTMDLT